MGVRRSRLAFVGCLNHVMICICVNNTSGMSLSFVLTCAVDIFLLKMKDSQSTGEEEFTKDSPKKSVKDVSIDKEQNPNKKSNPLK
ncbi:hypothetical protein L1987_50087 [Smallanthus sonchifolius]|uniref:Uncharacterized protein n=1 Tax=Smallanthus sonchifolius TaxID=185202 RepID=A0ACB9FWC8_9ASTR|nr:hypothetical protein L1987_50087 [Smallanthus sonchifolius]